jgi:hypothetical protein
MDEKQMDKASLGKLLYKIGQCINYQNLYGLEEQFNKVGLTIQTTSHNRMLLCKLINGAPIIENVVDDYIFIGSLDDMNRDLTEKTAEKIMDFVRTNAGPAGKIENMARVWRNGLRMYQTVIPIVNEDVKKIAEDMILG